MWCFIFDIQRCTQHNVIALTVQLESLQFSMFVRPRLSVCALVVASSKVMWDDIQYIHNTSHYFSILYNSDVG